MPFFVWPDSWLYSLMELKKEGLKMTGEPKQSNESVKADAQNYAKDNGAESHDYAADLREENVEIIKAVSPDGFSALQSSENGAGATHIKAKAPLRVFVVEDDQELSAVIERVLKSISSEIILDWATSAEAAILKLKDALNQHLDQSPYDLIVADIFLDGKRTGIDFWHTCQELFPEVPVLVTSALSLDKFFAAVGRQHISPPYLQKPFSAGHCKQVFEGILKYSDKTSAAQDGGNYI